MPVIVSGGLWAVGGGWWALSSRGLAERKARVYLAAVLPAVPTGTRGLWGGTQAGGLALPSPGASVSGTEPAQLEGRPVQGPWWRQSLRPAPRVLAAALMVILFLEGKGQAPVARSFHAGVKQQGHGALPGALCWVKSLPHPPTAVLSVSWREGADGDAGAVMKGPLRASLKNHRAAAAAPGAPGL